jgi:hypothetical protein
MTLHQRADDAEVVLPRQESPAETYIDVLRAFADEAPGGNTLTIAFGTWEKALAAAGLGARASPWRRARGLSISDRGAR